MVVIMDLRHDAKWTIRNKRGKEVAHLRARRKKTRKGWKWQLVIKTIDDDPDKRLESR